MEEKELTLLQLKAKVFDASMKIEEHKHLIQLLQKDINDLVKQIKVKHDS